MTRTPFPRRDGTSSHPASTLHVAAMPFPSPQGTQAAVRAMLDVLAGIGRETHLLTYAHGAFPIQAAFRIHRLTDFPPIRSLRSGPSVGKIALDAQMLARLSALHRTIRPESVVAHHVEAAAAALAARARPFVFFAHTALAPELPTYLSRRIEGLFGRTLAAVGHRADVALCRRADVTIAISPWLRDALAEASGVAVHYVPVPWPLPRERAPEERRAARRSATFAETDEVILYAGNLDRYQGVEGLLEAFARLARRHDRVRLAVATASDATGFLARARQAGVADRLRFLPMASEADRRAAYAIADVAAVPRRAPGGLPIKLLDALARGVPVVAQDRAQAGLPLRAAVLRCADDDPDALAATLELAFSARRTIEDLGALGRAYIASEHSPARFVGAFDEARRSECGENGARGATSIRR